MSRIYKSARGKAVDMDKVRLANEQTIAIGNMKVNARGDKLGAGGQVIAGRNQVMDQAYTVAAGPASTYSPNDPDTFAAREARAQQNQAEALFNLSNNLTQPIDETAPVEQPAVPAARGSLAGSLAKPATVVQQPLPRPAKKTGPTRL